MNINKNENSLKNNLYDANKITSKKIKLFNLKFIHRIFDSVNISLLICFCWEHKDFSYITC